jgi:two-component system, cell cycle sensor histidine kinase and response regulator CckA
VPLRKDDAREELLRERDVLGSALAASERLTRGILAAVPAGVVHVTRDGAVRNANAEALRLLGLSYDALTERYTSDFDAVTIWEDGTRCSVEDYPVTRALVTGEPQPPTTIGVKRPDGGLSWCIFRAVPVKDDDDCITGAVVTFLDITDRKATEDALRRSEAEIKAIVDSAPGIILTSDLDSRITFVSRVIPELNLAAEDLNGSRIHDWVNPRDHAMVEEHLERARLGETVGFELEGLEGIDPNWYSLRVAPIVREGEVVGFAIVATIVTEQKRAEAERAQLIEQLHQAQRLEALGRLAGGIAHDFNNLLTVIQGNTDLLVRSTREPGILEGLEEIASATNRASSLTRQLLAFGRRQALEPREIDLGEVAANLAWMLRRLLGEHVELAFERAPNLGLVRADPVAMERVIVNLAANGSEAMPRGGLLTIATENVEIAPGSAMGIPAGSYVRLAVSDTGGGIDTATQRRLFEPFFTTKGSGTGLGLPTVHGIVTQSGGHIALESTSGEGSRFLVLLPRVATLAEERGAEVARPATARSGRILLVEDDPAVRRVARSILESAGYEVVVADDAQSAMDVSDETLAAIDLLLTDVVMPHHSGPAIVEALRARAPRLKVLMISGHVKRTMGPLPVDVPFLHKPFTAAALVDRVARLIG